MAVGAVSMNDAGRMEEIVAVWDGSEEVVVEVIVVVVVVDVSAKAPLASAVFVGLKA